MSGLAVEQAAMAALAALGNSEGAPPLAQEIKAVTQDEVPAAGTLLEAAAETEEEAVEAAPEETEAVEEEAVETPKVDDKALAVLAKREKEQKAAHAKRVQELSAKEAAIQQAAKEVEAVKAKAAEYETSMRSLKFDPVGSLERLGLSKAEMQELATQVFYANMGDEAPAEFKARRHTASMEANLRKEIEELRKGNEARKESETAAQAEAYRQQYKGALKGSLETLESEKYPNLEMYREANGERLPDELMAIAIQMSQQRGVDPTHDEVLEAAEAHARKLYAPVLKKTATAAKPPAKPPTKTLKGQQSTSVKSKSTANIDDPDELERNAMAVLRSMPSVG